LKAVVDFGAWVMSSNGEFPMSTQDLLLQEIPCTSEPILAEVYNYLQYLKSKQAEDGFDGLAASQSVLSRDWDTPGGCCVGIRAHHLNNSPFYGLSWP
jgi:hypothetical protein